MGFDSFQKLDLFYFSPARSTDGESIFKIVNAAYELENGDEGIAFKRNNRYAQVRTPK